MEVSFTFGVAVSTFTGVQLIKSQFQSADQKRPRARQAKGSSKLLNISSTWAYNSKAPSEGTLERNYSAHEFHLHTRSPHALQHRNQVVSWSKHMSSRNINTEAALKRAPLLQRTRARALEVAPLDSVIVRLIIQ